MLLFHKGISSQLEMDKFFLRTKLVTVGTRYVKLFPFLWVCKFLLSWTLKFYNTLLSYCHNLVKELDHCFYSLWALNIIFYFSFSDGNFICRCQYLCFIFIFIIVLVFSPWFYHFHHVNFVFSKFHKYCF